MNNYKGCDQTRCRAPEGFSVRLIVPGSITTDQTECPENYISVMDPYNVKTYKVQPQEWVVCPALTSRGETTLFESFLNVIRLTERTGHTLDTFLVFLNCSILLCFSRLLCVFFYFMYIVYTDDCKYADF